jgi:lipoprotein-releasing system ATP-binding protein
MNKKGVEIGTPVSPAGARAGTLIDVPPLRLVKPIALSTSNLQKSYWKARHKIEVLKGIDLEVREGEFTAIVGASGSGKSTLMHLLGTLDQPDEGEIWFAGERLDNLPPRHREKIRNEKFGLVFQFYHLLPEMTTIENVLVPRMVQYGMLSYYRQRRLFRQRALELLDLVGLSGRINHLPTQLSGGEMQRAAIARALIANPTVLLADEPTGNLDRENGKEIMRILFDLQRDENLTIVMVTHDESIAAQADSLIRLADGRVC